MTEGQAKSGSGAAVVIVVALVVLLVPCLLGLVLLGAGLFLARSVPQQIAPPPVAAANAPLPGDAMMPGPTAIPANATITVNNMKWSQNLFGQSDEILTLARYDQIKPGMTYEELIAVLAIPENRRPDDIKYVTSESNVELKWFGGEGDAKSITVKLKGMVVIDKTQSGLD